MIKAKVLLKDAEVRGVEKRQSKKGTEYLLVRVDDLEGNRSDLLDRDLDRESFYKRGSVVDFELSLSVGKYTNVEIVDALLIKGKS